MSRAGVSHGDAGQPRGSRLGVALRAGLAVAVVSVSAWWGLGPIAAPALERPDLAAAAAPATPPAAAVALDTSAFHAPLWVAPPAPPPPPPSPKPPPPAPPLRLQLLAILREESGGLKAVLYDPDADSLVFASEGQVLQGRTVKRIDSDAVDLVDQGLVRRLALKDEPAQAGGGTP